MLKLAGFAVGAAIIVGYGFNQKFNKISGVL